MFLSFATGLLFATASAQYAYQLKLFSPQECTYPAGTSLPITLNVLNVTNVADVGFTTGYSINCNGNIVSSSSTSLNAAVGENNWSWTPSAWTVSGSGSCTFQLTFHTNCASSPDSTLSVSFAIGSKTPATNDKPSREKDVPWDSTWDTCVKNSATNGRSSQSSSFSSSGTGSSSASNVGDIFGTSLMASPNAGSGNLIMPSMSSSDSFVPTGGKPSDSFSSQGSSANSPGSSQGLSSQNPPPQAPAPLQTPPSQLIPPPSQATPPPLGSLSPVSLDVVPPAALSPQPTNAANISGTTPESVSSSNAPVNQLPLDSNKNISQIPTTGSPSTPKSSRGFAMGCSVVVVMGSAIVVGASFGF
ncbi:hypothetical protein NEOLI_004359 [Neolecta irregularis DAH-3]|uniref:Uncharacterized protein n=1 Tax=Neolecta irregularis (strain DAH-3) TaxID=1198029 RepID=A0A1U7LMT9_NEOID|nr:hypothetical protein NEOLI_004359 [Neolecta irregularis DAH-3]|eukprot:OLL23841.1 hypothetical protein NEOLI_004359 [Neolecta irregularis DAH-3]